MLSAKGPPWGGQGTICGSPRASELPISLLSAQKPRETRGKLGKGGAPIHLNTINGGIRVVALRSTV